MKTMSLNKSINAMAFSLSALSLSAATVPSTTTHATEGRPNILYIMSDDHSFQTIGVYASVLKSYVKTPNIDRIAHEGVKMENCFVTNSISTPSRAAILTGQYSHHNQVYTLADELPAGHPSLAKELQANGYQTAIIGKWHIGTQPEGFDFYSVMPGQGKYENPGFMETGLPFDVKHAIRTQGYCTDVITDKCIDWMEKTDKNKPFFLMCHFKAPHTPFTPAERHRDLYKDVTFPEPDNLYENLDNRPILKSVHNKVAGNRFANKQLPKAERVKDAYQEYIRTYLSCIAGIDENVGRLLHYLEEKGELDNTLIIYTSDQGFFMGEHGLTDKRLMYEEALRMPLLIRYPAQIAGKSSCKTFVQNIDFAPTLLEYAGIPTPDYMDGRSFCASLSGTPAPDARKTAYYRYWMNFKGYNIPAHYGLRTDRYKLIYFYGQSCGTKGSIDKPDFHPVWEFYDLQKDPKEMKNQYGNKKYQTVIDELKRTLKETQKEIGDNP